MKRSILFLLSFFVLTANAQDVIKLKDGKEIQAKISEINQTEIKYKNFDYLDGPTFTINKSDVNTITYANGITEEIIAEAQPAQSSRSEESGSFWKPTLYTNKRVASISPFIDLGGFVMSGGKIGIDARWRRLSASIAFKTAPSKFYWTIGGVHDNYELESISGSGFAYTFKVLLPTPNSNNVFHVGMTNEISDLEYVYAKSWSGRASESWQTSYFCTGLGGGFTHYKDNGLFFRASTYFGVSIGVGNYFYEHNWDDNKTRTAYWTDKESWVDFFGTIELAIGFEIPTVKK